MLSRQTTSASEAANEASRSAFEKKFPGIISTRPGSGVFRAGAGGTLFAPPPVRSGETAFVATPAVAARSAPPAMRIAVVSVSPPVARRAVVRAPPPVARAPDPADAVRVLTPRELGVLSAFANAIKKNARG